MCGSTSYDRDSYSTPSYDSGGGYHSSSSGFDYSSAAQHALYSSPPAPVRTPTPRATPSSAKASPPPPPPAPVKPRSTVNTSPQQRIACTTKNAVVMGLDVTGSTADVVLMFWDKIPMMYSELVDRGYLKEFSVSFAAVGDATCDKHPVQVTEFLTGSKLDEALASIDCERGGGMIELCESYELLAYYYANLVTLPPDMERKPFLFFIADEAPRDEIDHTQATQIFGGKHKDVSAAKVFSDLAAKYDVYVLCVPYRGGGFKEEDARIRAIWEKLLPGRALHVEEPKSVVDLALGIIATSAGGCAVDDYVADMKKRKQTAERRAGVAAILNALKGSES